MSKQNNDRLLPPLWIFTLIFCAILFWLMFQLKEIIVLLVLGYCVAYVMNPLLYYLERKRISRPWGVAIITLGALVFITLLAVTAVPTIARQYDNLATSFPAYVEIAKGKLAPYASKISGMLPEGMSVESVLNSPLDLLKQVKGETISKVALAVKSALVGGYSVTMTLINLALLPFIVFYLAVDFPIIHRRILDLFPFGYRRDVGLVASEINGYVSAFVRGQLTVGCILFLLYAVGLGLLGIDLWLLLALITGFGNIIPYFGFAIGIILSSIMALVTFTSFAAVLKVWAVFAIVQFLEGTFITPKVVGDKVGISPLFVILALVAGGQLFGLLGVFLAIPVAAALKVLLNHTHSWVLKRSRV